MLALLVCVFVCVDGVWLVRWVGKQTETMQSKVAAGADADACLSVKNKRTGQVLDVSFASSAELNTWVNGLKYVLTHQTNKKVVAADVAAPGKGRRRFSVMTSPAAAAAAEPEESEDVYAMRDGHPVTLYDEAGGAKEMLLFFSGFGKEGLVYWCSRVGARQKNEEASLGLRGLSDV